jgi:N-acetylated-alpha-linked acidic dipeptidase
LNTLRSLTCYILLFAFTQFAVAQTPPEQNSGSPASAPGQLLGYTAKTSPTERDWEKKFQDGIVSANIRESVRRLSARPHHVGSPYDKDNAEWMLARFKEWGFDAHIETFDVLFPTPKQRLLELVAPTKFRAKLQEPVLAIDPTSNQTSEQLPTYNAYSADGDVTAPLIYVNYGDREDYEQLDRMGVSVKGAIVIARYGAGWRGVKPKVAGEHGAIGCIIYSDPKGDGYFRGDDYPAGGWRPRDGVQRGSVMDTDYPGDPLTPGVGAVPGVKRLDIKDAKTITKIPVLPISYGDAQPLLSALQGQVAPVAWRGALPITYHIGPGPARVHLVMASDWAIKPIYDVIATLAGSSPDQWVIRGNHHDAWVNGADDPIAGMGPELEEARMLGEMHKQGWTPKRTIIYCAWDGEEPGLLGSVEWVETHREDLQKHAVLYLNSDGNERGFFEANGTQDLQAMASAIARDIKDPEKNISVFERAHLRAISRAKDADERSQLRKNTDLRVEALGDGSDYTAFQDYAGIPTADFSFGGEDEGDQYHSIYDDFYWYTHFDDTDFSYGRALAQTAGTAMMRMADADLLPYDYAAQSEAIAKYETELEKLLKDKQDEFTERNLELQEGVFTAIADPHKTSVPPPVETVPPFMNFAPMKNSLEQLKKSADRYSKVLARFKEKGSTAPQQILDASLDTVNADLLAISRLFLNEKGLPERPWFKNQIYAPGAYTGYGAKPIAAVREYMDEKKWQQADAQIPMVAQVVENVAAGISKAADDLEAALKSK